MIRDAKVKVCFALREHVNAGSSFGCTGDEAGIFNGLTVQLLLDTFPAVWVSKNVLDGVLMSRPSESKMMLLDISLGALEKILDKICENTDSRFPRWEWR